MQTISNADVIIHINLSRLEKLSLFLEFILISCKKQLIQLEKYNYA